MRWILVLALVASETAFGAVSIEKLRSRIAANVSGSGIKRSHLGIYVGYKGQKIYSLNGKVKFIPASVSKILPAVVSLSKYQSNHQFETKLYSSARRNGEVLEGDLYLVGGGDPSFTSEDMWVLVNEFTREGLRRIEGDIVIDDSRFDRVRFDPGRDEDKSDRDKSYAAPVGGMSFNWNSVNVNVRPTRSGKKAQIIINPENDYIEVLNQTRTVSGRTNSISVERLGIRFTLEGHPVDTIRVRGSIGTRVKEVSIYRNITRPDFWSGAALKAFLKQRGIEVSGTLREGVRPKNSRLLARTKGKVLGHAVADLMKFSNNYMAEMLTKNIAYKSNSKTSATMEEGLEEIRNYLEKRGVERKSYVLTSPSGLSRRNKFRPVDFHHILEDARKNLVNFPEFLSAQAIGGVDGTLANRMKGNAKGRIRAKTGTLRGVVGLAGFALRPDGEVITFAMMYNGGGSIRSARRLYDQIAASLMR